MTASGGHLSRPQLSLHHSHLQGGLQPVRPGMHGAQSWRTQPLAKPGGFTQSSADRADRAGRGHGGAEAVLHQSHLQAASCTGTTLTQQPSSWSSAAYFTDTLLSSVLHKSIHPHTQTRRLVLPGALPSHQPLHPSHRPHTAGRERPSFSWVHWGGGGISLDVHVWKIPSLLSKTSFLNVCCPPLPLPK